MLRRMEQFILEIGKIMLKKEKELKIIQILQNILETLVKVLKMEKEN